MKYFHHSTVYEQQIDGSAFSIVEQIFKFNYLAYYFVCLKSFDFTGCCATVMSSFTDTLKIQKKYFKIKSTGKTHLQ